MRRHVSEDLDPERLMVEALTRASEAEDATEALRWLQVADHWEERIPKPMPEPPNGFAEIGPSPIETHRITFCVSPTRVAAYVDPRWGQPRGIVLPSVAKAAIWATEVLDQLLAEAARKEA